MSQPYTSFIVPQLCALAGDTPRRSFTWSTRDDMPLAAALTASAFRPAIAPALKPPKMRASSKAARASVGRNHHKPLEVNALRNFDYPEAILFDCDGVLCETERDGHRVTFNMTFQEKGLEGHAWDVDLYGELLKIGGGKERMTHYFNTVKDREPFLSKWPEDTEERRAWIKSLHLRKTDLFLDIVQAGKLPLRPGVARLVKEALDAGAKVAVSIIFSFIFVCVWAIRLMTSCFFNLVNRCAPRRMKKRSRA